MSDRRSGICAAARDFVRAHPGATGAEIKDGIAGADQPLRNAISSILVQAVSRGFLKCRQSPGKSLARPIRQYWIGDREPPGGVPGQPRASEPAERRNGFSTTVVHLLDREPARPESEEPTPRTWTPPEVQEYDPPTVARPPMPKLGEHEIAVVLRHAKGANGEPVLQFEIPARQYIDLLRRYV